MVFHEIYGSYYNVIAAVLKEAVQGSFDQHKIWDIIMEKAFYESDIRISDALSDGSWPLLRKDGSTPIQHIPTMPLSDLQKSWLNAVFQDPRVKLFLPENWEHTVPFPETEPLFEPGFFLYPGRYEDGDPFEEASYKEHFHRILYGLSKKRSLRIRFVGKGGRQEDVYIPEKLEYSTKDDKFRLIAHKENGVPYIINLGRVEWVQVGEPVSEELAQHSGFGIKRVVLELLDERNTLERAMIHFSDLQKETVRLDQFRYQLTLHYYDLDETEILIRILSFGPKLRVVAPKRFITLVKERLEKQKSCGQ